MSTSKNILEHQKTLLDLQESEERYRLLFEKNPQPMWVYDLQTLRFLAVNNAAIAHYGYSKEEFLSMTIKDIRPQDDIPRLLENVSDVDDGLDKAGIWRHIKKDGCLMEVEIVSHTQIYNHRPSEMVLVHDVTERRKAEKLAAKLEDKLRQSQKLEAIGRLAGGVAHDYNNMLTVIIGYTEMALQKTEPTDPLYADLKQVLNAGQRSADITRQLLAFARKQNISPQKLNMNDCVESLFKMLQRLIGEDIELTWHPSDHLWPINMDPSQVNQILSNLCINARDAIADVGKITIETENVTIDSSYYAEHESFVPGNFVLLAVSDDGCGIGKDDVGNIFEPFFTTKGMHQGTGLGLSTIYGIVKQNGGFINVYSELGKGTTFKVYLNRYEGAPEKRDLEKPLESPASRGETLLLVEDEISILELLKKMLDSFGYNVLTADSPQKAIRMAQEYVEKIHLLITDVIMPGMNGRELSDNIQAIHPEIKTLFMSGYTANVIAHHGVLHNGVNFVSKPISREIFAVKVRESLES